MTLPVVESVGTGDTDFSGTATIPYPATVAADDLLILQCGINNASDTVTTPSGWTAFSGNPYSGGSDSRQYLFWKKATGSESGDLSVTWTAANRMNSRIYRFSGQDLTTPLGTPSSSTGASGTLSDEGVTTTQADSLALNFFVIGRENVSLSAMSGMTGGTWVEDFAEYGAGGTPPDYITIGMNRADMASAGTINGGTATLTGWSSRTWVIVGVELFAGSSVAVDQADPDADVTTTGWTTTPLWSKVNDASDASYITATAS